MRILIEFEKVKNLIDFQDLLENLDACELPYTIKNSPRKWRNAQCDKEGDDK